MYHESRMTRDASHHVPAKDYPFWITTFSLSCAYCSCSTQPLHVRYPSKVELWNQSNHFAYACAAYRITVQGVLMNGGRLLEGMSIASTVDAGAGPTVTEGALADQSALVGVGHAVRIGDRP